MLTADDDTPVLPVDLSHPSNAKVSQVHDDQCDREIDRPHNNISDSLQERDEYRTLISPVQKVPVEIWTEIFSLFLGDSYGLQITCEEITASTLRLSRVCNFWRAVVMSQPKLWSNLHINIMHGSDEMVNAVAFYLDYSKTAPLYLNLCALDIRGEKVGAYGFKPQSWQVLKLFLDICPRWFQVEMKFSSIWEHERMREYISNVSGCCDILQSLTILGPPLHRSLLLEKTPQLQSLELHHFHKSFTSPLSNLVSITVRSFYSMEDMVDCLLMCPRLESANLATYKLYGEKPRETRLVCLPKLRSLKCVFEKCYDAVGFFKTLTLPALSRLELSLVCQWEWRKYSSVVNPHLQNLLLRSHCQLEHLKLRTDYYICDQELVQFLSLTPKLTHFELDIEEYKESTIALFQSLIPKHDKLSLLPQLTSLCIRSPLPISLPELETIFLVVKSRRAVDLEWQNKRLESFALVISYSEGEDSEWKKSFTSKVERGLRVLEEDGLKLMLQIGCDY